MKSFFVWMERHEGWKSMLAFVYAVICIFDFIIVPAWFGISRVGQEFNLVLLDTYEPSVQLRIIESMTMQHKPFTLQGGGLFHLAFGALLTGSALTNLKRRS